jgi:hypothetical protein
MLTIKTSTLKAAKTLKSGHVLNAGAEIISHAFLNQSSKEELEALTKKLDEAEFSLFKARQRKLKGDSLKVYSDAVKLAKASLEGARLPVAELFLILQGVHPVKLSPAERGVLVAALKGLSPADLA